jgi:hypothetical protein
MTRDDIIRMAYEMGGYAACGENYDEFRIRDPWVDRLERFAAQVAEAEREACAKLALAIDDQGSVNQRLMQKRIAAAILERERHDR